MGACIACLPAPFHSETPYTQVEKNVFNLFTKRHVLFSSNFSNVFVVTKKSTGENFVMKQMTLDDQTHDFFENEVYFLSKLSHPNIVGLEGAYLDSENCYICTTLCSGDCLIDMISDIISENMIANIIRIILETIDYCHKQNIVHCDLKPDNIIFDKEKNKLVIIDWADAECINDNEIYGYFAGTPHYIAPECMRNRYGWEMKKSDIFSIGVIAFVLLTGHFPFELDRKKLFPETEILWPDIYLSSKCKDFLKSVLERNPENRMSAHQALNHPWISHKKMR